VHYLFVVLAIASGGVVRKWSLNQSQSQRHRDVNDVTSRDVNDDVSVTSMIVCCGFVVCWTSNQVYYFLSFIGYNVYHLNWFYHFSTVGLPIVVPSSPVSSEPEVVKYLSFVSFLSLF